LIYRDVRRTPMIRQNPVLMAPSPKSDYDNSTEKQNKNQPSPEGAWQGPPKPRP